MSTPYRRSTDFGSAASPISFRVPFDASPISGGTDSSPIGGPLPPGLLLDDGQLPALQPEDGNGPPRNAGEVHEPAPAARDAAHHPGDDTMALLARFEAEGDSSLHVARDTAASFQQEPEDAAALVVPAEAEAGDDDDAPSLNDDPAALLDRLDAVEPLSPQDLDLASDPLDVGGQDQVDLDTDSPAEAAEPVEASSDDGMPSWRGGAIHQPAPVPTEPPDEFDIAGAPQVIEPPQMPRAEARPGDEPVLPPNPRPAPPTTDADPEAAADAQAGRSAKRRLRLLAGTAGRGKWLLPAAVGTLLSVLALLVVMGYSGAPAPDEPGPAGAPPPPLAAAPSPIPATPVPSATLSREEIRALVDTALSEAIGRANARAEEVLTQLVDAVNAQLDQFGRRISSIEKRLDQVEGLLTDAVAAGTEADSDVSAQLNEALASLAALKAEVSRLKKLTETAQVAPAKTPPATPLKPVTGAGGKTLASIENLHGSDLQVGQWLEGFGTIVNIRPAQGGGYLIETENNTLWVKS